MKKTLSMLFAVTMLLAIAPMTVSAYDLTGEGRAAIEAEIKTDNLAWGKTVIHPESALDQTSTNGNWRPQYLTDGSLNYDTNNGETGGYHSQYNDGDARSDHEEWAGIDFGAPATFDTLVIYPSSSETGTAPGFPNSFKVEVSDDNSVWTTLEIAVQGGSETPAEEITGFAADPEPVTIHFSEVTAQYVKFVGLSLNDDGSGHFCMKLSEMAVYYTAAPEEEQKEAIITPDVNLAPGAIPFYSGLAGEDSGGFWSPANLNNGRIEDGGGFTTNGSSDVNASHYVGYDLRAVYKINTVVLVSPYVEDPETNTDWAGIPKKFEIQVSNDNSEWDTVRTVENETVPVAQQAYTYTFDAVDARYIRIVALESYPKKADNGGTCYIQLAEMEVYYKTSTSGGEITPPASQTGDTTLAIVAVATLALISGVAVMFRKRRSYR